jgi:molecular chaperone GrpE
MKKNSTGFKMKKLIRKAIHMNEEKQDQKETITENGPETVPVQEVPAEEEIQPDVQAEAIDLDQLTADLKNARQEREEFLTLAQRVQADFDNYRRRNNSARAEAYDEGAMAFAKTLLPVIDNLERALEADAASADTLKEGVQMVYRQLSEAFEKRGISPIARLGEKFDPALENAVMTAPREEGEPGTICAVLQKGYKTDKTVLRHAMVKVVAD